MSSWLYAQGKHDQRLEWALATRQGAGIWGGLTEDERRTLRRIRRRRWPSEQ